MATTFDALMQRATQRKDAKYELKKFKSEALGIEITLHKPPLKKVTEMTDEIDESSTTYDAIKSNAGLVYESWKDVKDHYKELKAAYGAADPSDLILKIFDGNLSEVSEIAQEVIEFYGIGLDDAVKNS